MEGDDKPTMAARILAASQGASPMVADVINYAKPLAKPVGFIASVIIDWVGPFYLKLFRLGYRAYCELPHDLLTALAGLGLSFCGGAYCVQFLLFCRNV